MIKPIKTTLLIAGNEKEAQQWIRWWRQVHGDFKILMANVTGRRPFVYVTGERELRGVNPETHEVVFTGTCHERKDFRDLRLLCKQAGLL